MLIRDLPQDSEQWHDWRLRHIGASDAPAIMFLDRSRDRYRTWLEKTNQLFKPEPIKKKRTYETPLTKGKRLEPVARERYCLERGVFAPPVCVENTREGEEFQVASLDGFIEGDRVVEIKCPDDARTHLAAREGRVEEAYWVQVQHQMHVAQVPQADYVSFYRDDLVIIPVEYDERYLAEQLLPAEQKFWTAVETGVYPFPNEMLGDPLDLTEDPDAASDLELYLSSRRMREEAEEQERIALARIKCRLDEHPAGGGFGATLKWERRRGFIQYQYIPEVREMLKTLGPLDKYRGPDSLILKVERG